jgi:hypothetical protein
LQRDHNRPPHQRNGRLRPRRSSAVAQFSTGRPAAFHAVHDPHVFAQRHMPTGRIFGAARTRPALARLRPHHRDDAGEFNSEPLTGWESVRHVGPVLEDEKVAVSVALPWPEDDSTPLILMSFSTGFEQRSV